VSLFKTKDKDKTRSDKVNIYLLKQLQYKIKHKNDYLNKGKQNEDKNKD
jgi:hypothetical protein